MDNTETTDVTASSAWGFLLRILENALQGDLISIISTVITGLLALGFGWVLRKIYEHHKEMSDLREKYEKEIANLKAAHQHEVEVLTARSEAEIRLAREEVEKHQLLLERINRSVEGDGLWLSRPVDRPADIAGRVDRSIPILTVANLKGGVGKTTVTANLAAYFAARGKRVLAIDLDFQGSLSGLGNNVPAGESPASMLVRGQMQSGSLSLIGEVQGQPRLKILSSAYDLARTENASMIHWLTGSEIRDVRFLIADLIHRPEIQEQYDVIIFDNPPRLTTGAIQALAASRHVLIPTVLDHISVDAVTKFVGQLQINRALWPSLRLAGVVGTMTARDIGALVHEPFDASQFQGAETNAVIELEAALSALRNQIHIPLPARAVLPYTTFVADKAEIGRRAETGFAFGGTDASVNAIFARLGTEVADRIGLKIDA
jgi:cellulose biosynthesis protein BcsQ